ncbi:MAG: site-2 protease family protein [Deltaproteobacteria bacterium]|nr:site-2 protease family protein [Deltaproteobacteria bacterium]
MPASWNLEFFRNVVVSMIALILSIAVHEFGHALVADRLGDRLPRSQGRVTLNPLAHIDLLGTIALPLMGLLFGVGAIGWGRPVMIQPLAFTRKLRMKTGHLLVAIAGPLMNILFGIVISLVGLLLLRTGLVQNPLVLKAIFGVVFLNFILAFFNLLPFPPLDGGAVVAGLLSDRSKVVASLQSYGLYLAIAVMAIPFARRVYAVPAAVLYELWLKLLGIR